MLNEVLQHKGDAETISSDRMYTVCTRVLRWERTSKKL